MILRALIIGTCLIALPQICEAQASIEKFYEQIREEAEKLTVEKLERIERYQERTRSQPRQGTGFSIQHLEKRLELISQKITKNERELSELRTQLKTALAEDQREAVLYKRNRKVD